MYATQILDEDVFEGCFGTAVVELYDFTRDMLPKYRARRGYRSVYVTFEKLAQRFEAHAAEMRIAPAATRAN